jgi:hypothetical protein
MILRREDVQCTDDQVSLTIQKAALECDGDRMGAIVGLKFGEDIPQMAVAGLFTDPRGT